MKQPRTVSGGRRPDGADGGSPIVRILVVDDHPLIVKGIDCTLAESKTMRIIGVASKGDEALRLAKELEPDIVLFGIALNGNGGLEVAKRLHKESPRAKTIILSIHGKKAQYRRMIFSGAKGFLLRESPPEDIIRAIDAVQAGGTFFSPAVSAAIAGEAVRSEGRIEAPRGSRLTARETEVLALIAEGLSNKEIAGRLEVGVRTVETHRGRLMAKLDIRSTAGLTKYAVAKGLSKIQ
ncbi:MAG: response regulator [Elusimicrobiota bacterium]